MTGELPSNWVAGAGKVMVCAAAVIVKVWLTLGAALKFVLPPCVA